MEEKDSETKLDLEDLKKQVQVAIQALEELIRSLGSFNVIANISLINQARKLEDFKDFQEDSMPMVAEYVALLCLKNPFFLGHTDFVNPHAFQAELVEVQRLGMQIVTQIPMIRQLMKRSFDIESTLDQVSYQFISEEYYVRNPTFEHHHWDVIDELYSKFDNQLNELVGFTVGEAIDLCVAVNGLINEKVRKHFRESFKHADEQYHEILRYKAGGKLKNFYPPELLGRLVKLSKDKLKTEFSIPSRVYASITLGHHFSFTAKELSHYSEIDETTVGAFLDTLSISFQEVPIDFYEPQGIHPLKERPIIFGDNRYIVPSLSLLDWSIDKLLEKKLLTSPYSSKYSEVKGDYLGDKSLELLKRIMPSAVVYPNVEFVEGGKNAETDGILLLDNCLFVMEAKSHRITDQAKEGKTKRVQKHITEILDEAYKQALRVFSYIDSSDEVNFKQKKGKSFTIKGSQFKHRFIILTAYEQLSHITSVIKKGNDVGLFEGELFPYAVSLYDLIVVSEVFNLESLLPFYIQRRSDFFAKKEIFVNDELDILGEFFNGKLFTDHLNSGVKYRLIHFGGHIDAFNRYYFYEQGLSKYRVPKPSFKLSGELRTFVTRLEKSGLPNRFSFLFFLLMINSDTQEEFVKYLKMVKKQFKKDKQLHDFSMTFKAPPFNWGITYMVGNAKDLAEKLAVHCNYKLTTLNVDYWVSVGDTSFHDYNFIEPVIMEKTKV